MKRIALIGVSLALLSGCKQIENAINEALNSGTAHGIQRCFEINESEVASSEAIEMSCIEAIDRKLSIDDLEATARIDGTNPLELWVSVENHSRENIFTRAIVSLHYHEGGNYSRSLDEMVFFGIQPTDWSGETVYFREVGFDTSGASFCHDSEKDDCYTWSMTAFGVAVR